MKRCVKCGEEKPEAEFGISQGRRRSYCRECRRKDSRDYRGTHLAECQKASREWGKRNPGRLSKNSKMWYEANKERRRQEVLFKRYGVTHSEYGRLLEKQSGVCGICFREPPANRRLAVDHDHATGRVRGLLCTRCNVLLGIVKDNPDVLLEAAVYLERSR